MRTLTKGQMIILIEIGTRVLDEQEVPDPVLKSAVAKLVEGVVMYNDKRLRRAHTHKKETQDESTTNAR